MPLSSQCDICKSGEISLLYQSPSPLSITSDLRPWAQGVEVFQCRECGYIFKRPKKRDLNKIYQNYELFEDTDEQDQAIFIQGRLKPRTKILVETLASVARLPVSGKFLDVGCNKGFLIREFSRSFTGWTVFGHEVSNYYEKYIERIPRAGDFYTGDVAKIKNKFDLISMIHTLEHIENPQKFLEKVRKLLTPKGLLLIQVPNVLPNAFDILVFEHISHFSPQTLEQMLINAGFEVVLSGTQIVPKELTFISKTSESRYRGTLQFGRFLKAVAQENVSFLNKFEKLVHKIAHKQPLVVFGTAEVGTWVAGLLDFKPSYFVDESPWRIGQKHLGIPIKHPKVLRAGDNVILAMAPLIARNVHTKWKHTSARFFYPTKLD